MEKNQIVPTTIIEFKEVEDGFKIIEINVSDPAESLFSVVTPIKKQ
ncbi:hypothetical protein RCG19_20240 [Neobacillus sp. OS1-2]|nr:hypothetical protein [Neobacillus sp. OS1-2]WML39485.1 hypothetical protein RCG19_20240 [Neobacillus sp. OS1-2]